MELANIENLLEKYDNAATSLQEEAILKEYFATEDVAPHLLEYKALFTYFNNNKEERFTKTIPLKRKQPNFWWLSIAASVVLMVSIYVSSNSEIDTITPQEQELAEQALKDTQKAFQLISQNLNKGGNVAIAGLSEFEKAQNKVFKTEQ